VLRYLEKICGKPVDDNMRMWLVTIGTIMALGFAAAGALLFFPSR
jgi:hypothetical protein